MQPLCGPAASQDWDCWELQGIPGLAGREPDSMRGPGAAPAQDILGCPLGWGRPRQGWTRAGGSGQGCGELQPSPVRIGGPGRLP